MRITARVDYAVRAVVELAAAGGSAVKGDEIAENQDIPVRFLENILGDLRRSGLVTSRRGADGGYRLAVSADSIAIASIIRAVEGPLADVRGAPPEALDYLGPAQPLQSVWIATRAALRNVLEEVTVADVVADRLPGAVLGLLEDPAAWSRR